MTNGKSTALRLRSFRLNAGVGDIITAWRARLSFGALGRAPRHLDIILFPPSPGSSLVFGPALVPFSVSDAKVCLVLWDPRDCSLPGFSVYGMLQARILEWVAFPFSRGSSRPRDRTWVSYIFCISRQVLVSLTPPTKPVSIPLTGAM